MWSLIYPFKEIFVLLATTFERNTRGRGLLQISKPWTGPLCLEHIIRTDTYKNRSLKPALVKTLPAAQYVFHPLIVTSTGPKQCNLISSHFIRTIYRPQKTLGVLEPDWVTQRKWISIFSKMSKYSSLVVHGRSAFLCTSQKVILLLCSFVIPRRADVITSWISNKSFYVFLDNTVHACPLLEHLSG